MALVVELFEVLQQVWVQAPGVRGLRPGGRPFLQHLRPAARCPPGTRPERALARCRDFPVG